MEFVNIYVEKINVKNVEVVVFVLIIVEKMNVKNAEVLVYAIIKKKE
jgi:hypothetical protein